MSKAQGKLDFSVHHPFNGNTWKAIMVLCNIRRKIGSRFWCQVHRLENGGHSLIHLIHGKAVTWTDSKHKATLHPVPVQTHKNTAVFFISHPMGRVPGSGWQQTIWA